MPAYIALTYTAEVDWRQPEYADGLQEYAAFEQAHAAVLRGGHALIPDAINAYADEALREITAAKAA